MPGIVRPLIGCAGWSIPNRYADLFGPGESMLARYATRFPVVEINSSFYRPHRPVTYERWAATVPPTFRFSVKLPRTISHDSGLVGVGALLDRFLDETRALGPKLGGLLLQLPPSLALDARRAASFFRALRRRTHAPLVCEPRHPSWFSASADALLARHDVARAGVDPARVPAAAHPGGAQHWRYWRWHGSPRMYYSEYDETALADLAGQAGQGAASSPWIIFDNTAHGFAVANAARLQELTADA
ncbi:DUF72 domain-containing protein [uncultured Stenotrophomonas sp.]|uniref:DUF72 domain-containing protein n=1 Tax=uncultured Stenotrophomonas sp. TaxID=165438 RepID=UPI0028ED8D1C|nr:DUF72 domain-containing protein [uncultured Stenotrophomonas sp.]